MNEDYNKVKNMKEKENKVENQYERCVSCKKLTDIRKDMDINDRLFYVVGVGQLCELCHYELLTRNKK